MTGRKSTYQTATPTYFEKQVRNNCCIHAWNNGMGVADLDQDTLLQAANAQATEIVEQTRNHRNSELESEERRKSIVAHLAGENGFSPGLLNWWVGETETTCTSSR